MAASSDSVVTAKTQCVKKVSKPLMEKKRRARINKCLNQLKSLLESVYSNNIRKRKLEKADILELTVKHLRHLQSTERGGSIICDSAEYQAGYRSCLAGVSHYLLTSDTDRNCHPIMLHHFKSGLTGARAPDSSTAESDTTRTLMPTTKPLLQSPTTSLKKRVTCPSLQQNTHRNYSTMQKRTDICDMDRISSDALVKTLGRKKLKTTHFSLKNTNVHQFCGFPRPLNHNYWRPW